MAARNLVFNDEKNENNVLESYYIVANGCHHHSPVPNCHRIRPEKRIPVRNRRQIPWPRTTTAYRLPSSTDVISIFRNCCLSSSYSALFPLSTESHRWGTGCPPVLHYRADCDVVKEVIVSLLAYMFCLIVIMRLSRVNELFWHYVSMPSFIALTGRCAHSRLVPVAQCEVGLTWNFSYLHKF